MYARVKSSSGTIIWHVPFRGRPEMDIARGIGEALA